MLGIVLLILKIIGIILAVILGIILLLLCTVLFVPVRYKGNFYIADRQEETEDAQEEDSSSHEKKDIRVGLTATWLLRLVRVFVTYEESVRIQVKILFFTFMDSAKEKTDSEKKDRGRKKKGNKAEESSTAKDDTGQENPETAEENTVQKESDRTEREIEDKTDMSDEEEQDKEKKAEENAEKTTDKKRGFRQRISDILYTIRNFCDKLKEIKKKGNTVKELLQSEHMAVSRGLLGKQLRYLLKHTKPKKLEGIMEFGFEDPSTTGYLMAGYGILYSVWNPKLVVQPDFEKEVLHIELKLKGRIRACHFVKAVLRMILSRDVRQVIKTVKAI